MDAATVLAASGTAFALRYIRASMQAGIEIGFDWQTALAISAQTVKGAAEMLLEEKVHPEQLIDRVTTPQGCTIAGLDEMEMHGFSSPLIRGIKTSLKQIKGIKSTYSNTFIKKAFLAKLWRGLFFDILWVRPFRFEWWLLLSSQELWQVLRNNEVSLSFIFNSNSWYN